MGVSLCGEGVMMRRARMRRSRVILEETIVSTSCGKTEVEEGYRGETEGG